MAASSGREVGESANGARGGSYGGQLERARGSLPKPEQLGKVGGRGFMSGESGRKAQRGVAVGRETTGWEENVSGQIHLAVAFVRN